MPAAFECEMQIVQEQILDYALSYLRTEMGKILAQLDVEHPEDSDVLYL